MKIEYCFQIELETLSKALLRLDEIIGDLDADAMAGNESSEPELSELLEKLSDDQRRFPVEPGCDEEDD
jgi:hypothetical protein